MHHAQQGSTTPCPTCHNPTTPPPGSTMSLVQASEHSLPSLPVCRAVLLSMPEPLQLIHIFWGAAEAGAPQARAATGRIPSCTHPYPHPHQHGCEPPADASSRPPHSRQQLQQGSTPRQESSMFTPSKTNLSCFITHFSSFCSGYQLDPNAFSLPGVPCPPLAGLIPHHSSEEGHAHSDAVGDSAAQHGIAWGGGGSHSQGGHDANVLDAHPQIQALLASLQVVVLFMQP